MGNAVAVVLLGASVRALAGSALRAGLVPYGIDLFGDVDRLRQCPGPRLDWDRYPSGFEDALREAPPGPWMYTGGLENHPNLLERLAEQRPVWGIVGPTLRTVRAPALLSDRLRRAGLPVPELHLDLEYPPDRGRWLIKPRQGAGGGGIRVLGRGATIPPEDRRRVYLQEYVAGVPVAAIYVGEPGRTRFLGLSMQLIGTRYLHAAPFHYAGSVGPLPLVPSLLTQLRYLGRVLGERGGLRGIFGVDGILRNNLFFPVEVNPRYTASVEVLEFATGQSAVGLHRRVFEPDAPAAPPFVPAGPCVGKAIICAGHDTTMPDEGPWSTTLAQPPSPTDLPPFADVTPPGWHIPAGRPILSVLVAGGSVEECLAGLQRRAKAVLDVLPREPS